jgi:hypothetical protein
MQPENTVKPVLRFAWRTGFYAINQDKSKEPYTLSVKLGKSTV